LLFQESLRPDLISDNSNLNRTHSSSGELNGANGGWVQRVSYNDLCFPKTSNYGSMKKKKQHSVGVDCRLNAHNFRHQQNSSPNGNNNVGVVGSRQQQLQTPSPLASHSMSYY
jgi:hypothetical protein